MKPWIDYSQWRAWNFCPWQWYEKYVNRRQKPYGTGPRDDAMALGSLTHAGLQRFLETATIEVPHQIVEEIGPTRECLELAHSLTYGYAQRYGGDPWEQVVCETPLTFGLGEEGEGLAKLDTRFQLTAQREVESGVEGEYLHLTPGLWGMEFKTKDPSWGIGIWMNQWRINMQASFQLLALRENFENVQGVLVSILEKPKVYIPKRKCKVCQTQYEFSLWLPKGEEYACPICGNLQKLQPLKEDRKVEMPAYYRMTVVRTTEELERDRLLIFKRLVQMNDMRAAGMLMHPMNDLSCVDLIRRKNCQYFEKHLSGESTLEDPSFVEVEDYTGRGKL